LLRALISERCGGGARTDQRGAAAALAAQCACRGEEVLLVARRSGARLPVSAR
jgi:hypothetical protein